MLPPRPGIANYAKPAWRLVPIRVGPLNKRSSWAGEAKHSRRRLPAETAVISGAETPAGRSEVVDLRTPHRTVERVTVDQHQRMSCSLIVVSDADLGQGDHAHVRTVEVLEFTGCRCHDSAGPQDGVWRPGGAASVEQVGGAVGGELVVGRTHDGPTGQSRNGSGSKYATDCGRDEDIDLGEQPQAVRAIGRASVRPAHVGSGRYRRRSAALLPQRDARPPACRRGPAHDGKIGVR
jgi:hypothetical protein